MKKPILPCVAAITIVLALASFALAQDGRSDSNRWGFNLGIGGTFSTSEYRGVERLGTALPILGYEGQWLYLRGLSGGVHLFKNEALPGFPWVADLLMSFPEGTNEGYGPIFSDSRADRALVC